MHIAIDAVGIRGHGGAAVLCELLYWLPIARPDWRWHVFLFERDLREFDDPKVSDKVTLEFTRCGNSGATRLGWVNYNLQKRLREIGADLIFSVANIGARRPVVPQVVFVHQLNAFNHNSSVKFGLLNPLRMSFLRWQILSGAKASTAVIVQTESMGNRMQQFEPSLAGRIQVIPSGYRTIAANPRIREDVRETILSSSTPRLIYVSHPSEHKNHLNLIRSLPSIVKIWPSLRLLLTLQCNQFKNKRYASFVAEIRKTAISLDVEKYITFLGILNPDEVYYALSNCDVMVFPSLAESFGLGLVEAMAANCPIAASNLPYARNVAGDAAIYFDPDNPESIARSCLYLLDDPSELARLKKEGARLITEYSYANIAELIARVFETHGTAGGYGCQQIRDHRAKAHGRPDEAKPVAGKENT